MTQEQRFELLPELRVDANRQDNLKALEKPDGQLARRMFTDCEHRQQCNFQ